MSDLIERQVVLNLFPTHDWKHLYDAVKNLPSAELATNLQQSCNQLATDCISRQAAIDAIYHHLTGWTMDECRMMLHEVPSAQPDSKELSPTHKALDTISRKAAIDALENTK